MQVLITRPAGKGESLVAALRPWVDGVVYQPLIDIVAGSDFPQLAKFDWNAIDGVIFVSGFAVDYFIRQWPNPRTISEINGSLAWYAVGEGTGQKLRDWGLPTVIQPQSACSEGLLALPALQSAQINGQHFVIMRGNEGRELLAEQLRARGATVQYQALYQRQRLFTQTQTQAQINDNAGQRCFEHWQKHNIDCIVVTSVEILNTLLTGLPKNAHSWLKSCRYIVASERIGEQAQLWGIPKMQIIDAKGANDQAILTTILQLTEKEK